MAIATINPATGVTEREFDAHTDAEIDARIGQAHDANGSQKRERGSQHQQDATEIIFETDQHYASPSATTSPRAPRIRM